MSKETAYEIVKKARKSDRPTALELINAIFDNFIELHGDRNFGDDKSVVGGIAFLNELPVTVVGIQKGQSLEDNIYRNFGQPNPEGYRKALRLMKQAEKFNRPVITFINTSGAYCGIGAEERGQGEAIARNLFEMSQLKVPVISIIIGEGGSGGALALAVADRVWILENAIYSILSPEGFASILWHDSNKAAEAAELMRLTAKDLLSLGIVDKIISERRELCSKDLSECVDEIKMCIASELEVLIGKESQTLTDERYNRFRKFGDFNFG